MVAKCEDVLQDRMSLYEELTPGGKRFVDDLARRLIDGMQIKRTKRDGHNATALIGITGARELALALLHSCWDGGTPKGWNWKMDEDGDGE